VNPALVTAREGSPPAVVIRKVREAELDEMWSFVGRKKQPRWLWEALDHRTGRVVAYVFGHREDQALLELKALLAPLGIRRFYTDGWGAYGEQAGDATAGTETSHSAHAEQTLVRKTICFSRSLAMHELVIGLFINRFEFGLAV
jgi:insertion element IS1 protein InsB